MRLDRNINADGMGKYALILMRKLRETPNSAAMEIAKAMDVLEEHGLLDHGDTPDSEFFVLRLKDQAAGPTLHTYGRFYVQIDPQWAEEALELARRAYDHPGKKMPD
jgi:hypothetical protein